MNQIPALSNPLFSKSALTIALLALLASVALAAPSADLDGQTFAVEVRDSASGESFQDVLTFSAGTLRSSACADYGFSAAGYDTDSHGRSVAFSSEAASATDGSSSWSGQVSEGRIVGSMVWTQADGSPSTYTFSGQLAD